MVCLDRFRPFAWKSLEIRSSGLLFTYLALMIAASREGVQCFPLTSFPDDLHGEIHPGVCRLSQHTLFDMFFSNPFGRFETKLPEDLIRHAFPVPFTESFIQFLFWYIMRDDFLWKILQVFFTLAFFLRLSYCLSGWIFLNGIGEFRNLTVDNIF